MCYRALPAFLLMNNPIQTYDWGSRDALTTLFGIANPSHQPQAELWMGAHPNGCSEVILAGECHLLSALIKANPTDMLGMATVNQFGRLPFLFKVLAAERALSIQVHPTKAQAQAGFTNQQHATGTANAGSRNYQDANHKPELVFALTPYQAMNGFRPIPAILALFERVNLPHLHDLTRAFAATPTAHGLQHFFHQLLLLTGPDKEQSLADLVTYAGQHLTEETFALINTLAKQYPNDVGLFAPLLLNVVTLQPGEAMFLAAGTPHAYIHGTGLEIMANSDNVLRAGLTPKHIDVAELLACTDCVTKPAAEILLTPTKDGAARHFEVPVNDFSFSVYDAGVHPLTTTSAEIIFAIDAPATLHQGEQTLRLELGQSAFIPAVTGHYQLVSEGTVARAANR